MKTNKTNNSSTQQTQVTDAPYWRTPQYACEIAQTALSQILAGVDRWTFFSWGVSKMIGTFYEDKPTLALRVSGLAHKGWVLVSLDEGRDVYEVRLKGETIDSPTQHTLDEVYCDMLGETIDRLVERPADMTGEEYREQAMADSAKKWAAGA